MASKYQDSLDALLLTDAQNHLVVTTAQEAAGVRQFYYRKMQEMFREFRRNDMPVHPKKCVMKKRANGWHLWLELEKTPDYQIINQEDQGMKLQFPESE